MSEDYDRNWNSAVCTVGEVITPANYTSPRSTEYEEEANFYDDLIKRSYCKQLSVIGITEWGCSQENTADFVGGEGYLIKDCEFGGPRTSVVIKGAIDGWRLVNSKFIGAIEVGQFGTYWRPGDPPTRGGVIEECYNINPGKPLTVWLWDATRPTVIGGNVRIIAVPKWIWFPYFLWRYVAVRIAGKPITPPYLK